MPTINRLMSLFWLASSILYLVREFLTPASSLDHTNAIIGFFGATILFAIYNTASEKE